MVGSGKSTLVRRLAKASLGLGLAGVVAVGALLSTPKVLVGEENRLASATFEVGGGSWGVLLAKLTGRMDPALLQRAREYEVLHPSPLVESPLPGLPGATPTAADAPLAQALASLTPDQTMRLNAAIPFDDGPNPAARPFFISGASEQDQARALHCLTQAIYYEAGFEPLAGREAVAQVVLNRVRHPAFPRSVCGVVYQGSELATGCQFTFTCDGALARPPVGWAWREAEDIARRALNGYVMAAVGEATHYHTQWVLPYWAPHLVKLKKIGAHLFYRWAGGWGRPAAFRASYAGGEVVGSGAPQLIQASLPSPTPMEEPAPTFGVVKPAASVAPPPGGSLAGDRDSKLDLAPAVNAPAELSKPAVTIATLAEPVKRTTHIAVPSGF